MDEGFELTRPVYTPREVANLFTTYVRHISYPTVLDWVQIYDNTAGKQGIKGSRTPRGRILIEAEEVERILLNAGAKKKG